MQVLVVQPPHGTIPDGAEELVRHFGWRVRTTDTYQEAIDTTDSGAIDAALVAGPGPTSIDGKDEADFARLLQHMDARRIAGIVLGDDCPPTRPDSLIDVVEPSISIQELRGRFAMIDRFRGHLRQLEGELSRVERLSRDLTSRFEEIDQELHLASRLQRDFLPDLARPIRNVQFEALYRPASWVSGDMFDVFKINEHCTGFYIADAVGHGMAASLLTMFIRRVLVRNDRQRHNEDLLNPSNVLARINDTLTEQQLPQCQFVTACYGVIDHRNLSVRLARGGHPYPVLFGADGRMEELKSPGGLLGVFHDESFETVERQLRVGDKLLLYTDGAELLFSQGGVGSDAPTELLKSMRSHADTPLKSMIRQFEENLDAQSQSDRANDDVSILGMEILRAE